jgi:hypothetical protein
MENRIDFSYGEFYDVPRMLSFQYDGRWYLMRSYFDEEQDCYADVYHVYLLPFQNEEELKAHSDFWRKVSQYDHLGQIPISEVGLDPTLRRSLDGDSIQKWLSARK